MQHLVIRNLSVEFRRYRDIEPSLKGRVLDVIRRRKRGPEVLAALSGISPEIGVGERVGVVGMNGAGKSTVNTRLAHTDISDTALRPSPEPLPPRRFRRMGDDGFTAMDGETYVQYRLQEQLRYFRNKTNTQERTLQRYRWLIWIAGGLGTLLVWAASNANAPIESDKVACDPRVLAVARSTRMDLHDHAAFGRGLDLVAPGVDVYTTASGARPWRFGTACRLAAPIVAGVAGLVIARDPSLTRRELADRLVGGVFGTIGFMYGVGSLAAWIKMALGEEVTEHPEDDPNLPQWARYFSFSVDHKVIGVQYGVTSLLIFAVAGLFALIFRTELIKVGMQFLEPQIYNTYMSLHGIVMIAAILLGVGAMTNYLVPLLVGASDMAFPRMNGFAYWINVPGALILLSSLFLGGFDTGWVGYPPLSVKAPLGIQMFFLGVYIVGLSSILGAEPRYTTGPTVTR